MNDDLLSALQQQPDARFVQTLHERLRHQSARPATARARPVRRIATAVTAAAAVVVLFAMPAMRAYAESFLAMFRVANFVGVRMDTRTLQDDARAVDLSRLLGEQVQFVQDPGRPVNVTSVAAASAAAHFTVAEPTDIPRETRHTEIAVQGAGVVRITADSERLRDLLDALNIRDLAVPQDLDGKVAVVRTGPVVRLGYSVRGLSFNVLQTTTPDIALPGGIDLAQLGEMALRISGMPRIDAHRFAQTIDWHSTVLVPVPPNAEQFRQVDVNGHQGLMVQSIPLGTPERSQRRLSSLLWSTGSRVFAVQGTVPGGDVLQIANSIR
jgi:hypothetical protein